MRAAIAVMILALATTGCATMFNDSSGPVTVTSQRPAELLQNGVVVGAAPGEITETGLIEARQEGCEPHVQSVKRSIAPSFFANLLWFGFFPVAMLVDVATGDMWEYSPSQFHVPCQPITGA